MFTFYNTLQFYCPCVKTRSIMYPSSLQQIGTHISSLPHVGKVLMETAFDHLSIRKLMHYYFNFPSCFDFKLGKGSNFWTYFHCWSGIANLVDHIDWVLTLVIKMYSPIMVYKISVNACVFVSKDHISEVLHSLEHTSRSRISRPWQWIRRKVSRLKKTGN